METKKDDGSDGVITPRELACWLRAHALHMDGDRNYGHGVGHRLRLAADHIDQMQEAWYRRLGTTIPLLLLIPLFAVGCVRREASYGWFGKSDRQKAEPQERGRR